MISDVFSRWSVRFFVLAFFLYLFGPLLLMGVTAFNSSSFPRAAPWDCFSTEWFSVLIKDRTLMNGLINSLVVAFGVVCISVPIGLAAALMLTQVRERIRPYFYTVIIAPILVPGVVLGISTVIFWGRVSASLNLPDGLLYNGILLTIIGQATFISAYVMLVFIARLQRFDPVLEEAALDLGATHVQAFRKVLLPFMKPAIGSAAVLAFLASFENYNTTVFTILSDQTLTTVLANKVRLGINPSISALAVIIVGLTLIGAIVFEISKRRESALLAAAGRVARGDTNVPKVPLIDNAAKIFLVVLAVAISASVWYGSNFDSAECKSVLLEEKRERTRKAIEARQQRDMFRNAAPDTRTAPAPSGPSSNAGGLFDPSNLAPKAPEEEAPAPSGGLFDPALLKQQGGQE